MDLELWADSFHEGEWAANHVGRILNQQAVQHDVEYLRGFQPYHHYIGSDWEATLRVFGSYRSWSEVPDSISELLNWGKPDFLLYDRNSDEIFLAVEETAAVPTGNQALQRCERIFGAAKAGVPFWYLIGEYGRHRDGGVRRDSIWPTVMALKLTEGLNVPSVVLHYSDIENPEEYSVGTGLDTLFRTIGRLIVNIARGSPVLDGEREYFAKQYLEMLEFIDSQWDSMIDFLPGADNADYSELSQYYAYRAQAFDPATGSEEPEKPAPQFLVWPHFEELPRHIQAQQEASELYREDPLAVEFEKDVERGRAYTLSKRTGSRPQPPEKVEGWLESQREMLDSSPPINPPAEFSLELDDFPESQTGRRHLTTARNILYLYDSWSDVAAAIERSIDRLNDRVPSRDNTSATLVYISNSATPRRIFGDPYTGQLSAWSVIFGRYDEPRRRVLAYYPHQVHTQVLHATRDNKGLIIMRELADYLLFGDGVLIESTSNQAI